MKHLTKNKIYRFGDKLGLSSIDIDNIIIKSSPEQIYFSTGPNWYPGGRYGTFSIKDIK
ncbi:MAG: hypothetical protein JSU91_04910 [Thermoplasmatales archaeon]|nr:MAG: hypothetical protein JSU91_04910 [Thermoplasmatales archaeon]